MSDKPKKNITERTPVIWAVFILFGSLAVAGFKALFGGKKN